MLANPLKSPSKRQRTSQNSQIASLGTLVSLPYSISKYSSYSASYYPNNIIVDNPLEQASRWSSSINDQNQFLILKLQDLSVLRQITFGKFHKGHVCNLKEFKVFVAHNDADDAHWIEVLHAGLRNDSEPETFTVRFKSSDMVKTL
jgi:hypothetical protein